MKHAGYVTRALKAADPRYARILGKLGYDVKTVTAETPSTDIPPDWQDLPWPDLKSLAARIAPGVIRTKDDAINAIQSEITRREQSNSSP